ncbi:lipoprotein signal peptidase [Bartonella henselae]|uniref:Lipoprotein signal peptidase n=1 Tax=Bartonella henselae (strain ATCC 49882 / DSM 28221 / CCUG 30454 / Houston 1) TaxID=283166 RepID=LSPA_BARHE|nr:signal peptidase II [Bartonella henselae]Q6G5A2.1 RecName: Full=Lipoprotein signal peptidase; AltName: Full=Prolipoprotein signal peptidase; AltName: Full=Signal peptidase II; Short=SPase II [Bartonella henselae str. Houston-1]ATP11669.1 lipoprotein signal peptidase [Bartonella henselae]ETS09322.1 lipoprotein signal peptidase [Bartonella henselae JK 50]ETS09479.1 lipoprotein signal peptidase [Bartonella henselae JK 51]MDM9990739.1 signal peptidase II [Bartonella henselae]OLL37911.1 lipopro
MTRKSFPFFLLGLILTVGIDQAVKYWVMHNIPLGTETPLLPFLSLYHVRNSGIAFSFFSSFSHWGLIFLTLIILIFLLWLWKNTQYNKSLTRFGFTLIIGGAIGNLIDRICFYYVIDYILFYINDVFYFAVFNLADTFITLGVIAIIIEELLSWIKRKSTFSE